MLKVATKQGQLDCGLTIFEFVRGRRIISIIELSQYTKQAQTKI